MQSRLSGLSPIAGIATHRNASTIGSCNVLFAKAPVASLVLDAAVRAGRSGFSSSSAPVPPVAAGKWSRAPLVEAPVKSLLLHRHRAGLNSQNPTHDFPISHSTPFR